MSDEQQEQPRTAPPFPAGPLNEPDEETVAVRVTLEVRVSGTVDVWQMVEDEG